MPNDKLKNYLHLHVLVFIAGFTAILGQLISLQAIPLVWYRMIIALVLMYFYILIRRINIKVSPQYLLKFFIAGVIIALHWITFFHSIKVSTVSIALVMFSTGAFFASFIEPIIYKRKIIWYETIFGIMIIAGVAIIMKSEFHYLEGIIYGIVSAFLSSLFAVLNGKFLERYTATTISFYEFISGVIFITIFMFLFNRESFSTVNSLIPMDVLYLLILGSVCTAYAFIGAVYVMRYISPFTVVLTYNLEPIYGIILALIIFSEADKLSPNFFVGATLVFAVVMVNGILKNLKKRKKKISIPR
ncbi:DMT family transporter [Mangrovimonas sp. AS39]|uniref:DMT family transporter n=1 Tax=Mangrovimonas futianensis TaxID=2895523 RepID=UPI001E325C91|nr:DMT family transporter [Mangrovimonas futianensis]MCF1191891.1 DMT family transporter [Mangrovimonas futianensis]MCF1195586.1 DMT family transporter [Mangrovimonas futianensis]